MFQIIPGYPNYEFDVETLEVRSFKKRVLKLHRSRGYYQVHLFNNNGEKIVPRSWITWLITTGNFPKKSMDIDHIDADKTNDHFHNLQLLTRSQNVAKSYQENGRVLPTGVGWISKRKKYQTRIRINGKQKHIGYYNTVLEASEAYQKTLEMLWTSYFK